MTNVCIMVQHLEGHYADTVVRPRLLYKNAETANWMYFKFYCMTLRQGHMASLSSHSPYTLRDSLHRMSANLKQPLLCLSFKPKPCREADILRFSCTVASTKHQVQSAVCAF